MAYPRTIKENSIAMLLAGENNKERTIKELDEYLFNKYGFNDFEKKYIKQIIKEK